MKKQLYVLIACEESQAETKEFRRLGHIAYSCDIQKCARSGNPNWHIWGDVRPFLKGRKTFKTQSGLSRSVPRWDLIIAHPPCTYLCKLSSVALHKNADHYVYINGRELFINFNRYRMLIKGRAFFFDCLNARAKYVAVENPLPMALARLPHPTTYACPSWFGSKYTKKTLYWLKNLPPLLPTCYPQPTKSYVSSSRGKYRSRTLPQLAKAVAEQWSEYILNDFI